MPLNTTNNIIKIKVGITLQNVIYIFFSIYLALFVSLTSFISVYVIYFTFAHHLCI